MAGCEEDGAYQVSGMAVKAAPFLPSPKFHAFKADFCCSPSNYYII
jgi:hypothetical protein